MAGNAAPKAFVEQLLTLDGVTKSVGEWCTEKRVDPYRVYVRRSRFKPWEEAFDNTVRHGDGMRRNWRVPKHARPGT